MPLTKAAAPTPITLKDVQMSFGAVGSQIDFARHVSAVTFTPTSSTITWKGLSPDAVFTDVTSPTWVCEIAYAQDWAATTSFSRFLYDNDGTTQDARFEPKTGGVGFTCKLIIVPGAIGGAIDSTAVATVTLGVLGKPVLTVTADT